MMIFGMSIRLFQGLGTLDSVFDSALGQLLSFLSLLLRTSFLSVVPTSLVFLIHVNKCCFFSFFCRDKIVFIKPPWTLADLLQLLDK